jgi:hypothetical protein
MIEQRTFGKSTIAPYRLFAGGGDELATKLDATWRCFDCGVCGLEC